MSQRIETIKRLAETDPYWRGYLDGMNRTREADYAEYAEYARLQNARLDRANEAVAASLAALVAERSEYATVQETRDHLRARREADMYRPVNNAADLGAPRVP